MRPIRAHCPACGDIYLTVDLLTVRECVDDRTAAWHARCPHCQALIGRRCSRRMRDLLVSLGVHCDRWMLPLELSEPHPTGPPFTADDLLDFHQLLARTSTIGEWVREIKEHRQ